MIIEGPHEWPVRPVLDFYGIDVGEFHIRSGPIGAIRQVKDNLVDFAVRDAGINDHTAGDVRARFTSHSRLRERHRATGDEPWFGY
jgi:hypothetical protein